MNHLTVKPRKRMLKRLNIPNNKSLLIIFETLVTFMIFMFSLVFFRSENAGHAFAYISGIFSWSSFTVPGIMPMTLLFYIVLFFVAEWFGREQEYAIATFGLKWPRPLRWAMYYLTIFTILYFSGENQQFIYFQF